jgi:Na+/proline symporter/nitrogen-specific signal transduction histidine kinase
MLNGPFVIVTAFVYLGLLFAIAAYADRRADEGRSVINNATVYALSLAVYCTTWTYYGSVGRAAVSGIGFLPIYLGPTLAVALWWFVLRKMIRVSKANRITSIADFVSSRYGKSYSLGALVTLIAVVGVVPYIALQLKAVSNSFSVVLGYPDIIMPAYAASADVFSDHTLYIALLLAAFIILFGTRHLDAAERHEGMVAAIAVESIVKLVAFIVVGIFVTYGLFDGFGDVFQRAQADAKLSALLSPPSGKLMVNNWFSLTLLSVFAIMFLPRQFQIAVVENVSEAHLKRAIWLFPLYLLAINLFVLPIALGGMMVFSGQLVDADTFVLTLPMAHQKEALALLVFIGGLAAATGMVIVETIALSTMVCNDLVMPALIRSGWLKRRGQRGADLSPLLLSIRRASIIVLMLMGYAYFKLAGEAYALVAIGLISFAAVAQFAPVILGGLYWRNGTRDGAFAGLLVGFMIWAYTLLLPSFAKSGWLPMGFLEEGMFGWELLKPQRLFGLSGLDETSHSLFWSLLFNTLAYVGVSLWRQPTALEAKQASLFVLDPQRTRESNRAWRGRAEVTDLIELNSRFLGGERAREAFEDYAKSRLLSGIGQLKADAELVHFAETLLAGAIGSASAHVMVASVVTVEPLGLDEVMHILDEASQIRAYSRRLEEKSQALEHATRELRAANERLRELDHLKDDFMSTVTHELRTPLTSIRALAEILVDDPRIELEQRRHFLGIIVGETERLTRLVNQILDLAKLESGMSDWHVAEVDLRTIVEQSATTTRQLFKDKNVSLTVHLPPDNALIEVDRDRFVQVLINLLSNAVKFVDAGTGKVDVSLIENPSEFVIAVADNGPGIRPEDQGVVFEKFRQVGNVMTDKPAGTGLGLPISRQIVEHFGGRLWVESEPAPGACFKFSVPKNSNIVRADRATEEEGKT